MEQRRLGNTGLKVSAVGLGCNNFGMRCDAAQTSAVVDHALEHGVTLFDTADVYGRGQSETLLGQALGTRRKDIVIASKVGMPMGRSPLERGGSRRYVIKACEASLSRLGTDYIDLYQLHAPDAETPIEETLEAFDQLVRAGKIRYAGCSNFKGYQLVDALWTSRSRGLTRFVTAQNAYNLLERTLRHELLPACTEHRVGILPYFPLANGLLSGKYKRGEAPDKGWRLGLMGDRAKAVLSDPTFDKLERLEAFARERGKSLLELAFAFLLSQPEVSSVIAGATKPEQIQSNAAAGDWRLTPADQLALAPLL